MLNRRRLLLDTELACVSGGLFAVMPEEYDGGGGSYDNSGSYDLPPEYYLDQIYAVEFILDEATGEVTTNLYLDDGYTDGYGYGAGSSTAMAPDDGGITSSRTQAPKCVMTLSKQTTTVTGSGSVSANLGILGGSRSTGSTTTTTTRTLAVDGRFINGRCVIEVPRRR